MKKLIFTFMILGLFKTQVRSQQALSVSADQNSIQTITYKKANLNAALSNYTKDDVDIGVAYFDGLGRPMQSIAWKHSPSGNDVINGWSYDFVGRKDITFLPFTDAGTNGSFRTGVVRPTDASYPSSAQSVFYNTGNGVAIDGAPYIKTIQEAGPDSRVLKQGAAGIVWQPDENLSNLNDHSIKTSYDDNKTTDDVIKWSLIGGPWSSELYEHSQLYKTTTTDEHGTPTQTYTDVFGRVVLKQIFDSEANAWHDTYYSYDHKGNLIYVFPPELSSRLAGSLAGSSDLIDQYAFQYKYDHRNRMISKKVPGARPVLMIYDERDRLVLTQDGNQKGFDVYYVDGAVHGNIDVSQYEGSSYQLLDENASVTLKPPFSFEAGEDGEVFSIGSSDPGLNSTWSFIKYDELNRPVMTGLVSLDGNQTEISAAVKALGLAGLFEVRNSGVHGYTVSNTAPEALPTNVFKEILEVHTVTYYDDYAHKGQAYFGNKTYDYVQVDAYYQNSSNTAVVGQVTGTKVKVLGSSNDWIYSTNYYDDKYRLIQSFVSNIVNGTVGYDRYSSSIDFLGMQRFTHRLHSGAVTKEIKESYEYDDSNRLKRIWHQVDNNQSTMLVEMDYNELGELTTKRLGTSVQAVDYSYNIRGWLTKMNNGTSLTENDKFGMELQYDAAGQYNGNIGKMLWKTEGGNGNQSTSEQFYNYAYDDLNRLVSANYAGSANGIYTVDNISYDMNGNIETLRRRYNSSTSYADNLDYDYEGNQLTSVGDSGDDQLLFNEVNSDGTQIDEYEYDRSGNMIRDNNKDITSITYNHLNLPSSIAYVDPQDNIQSVDYTYDAQGTKLKKVTTSGADKMYVGGIQYEAGLLQFVQTSEGRYDFSAGVYEYDLKDHLGNVRVTLKTTSNTFDRSYAFEGSDPYPFNMDEDGMHYINGHNSSASMNVGSSDGMEDGVENLVVTISGAGTLQFSAWSNAPWAYVDFYFTPLGGTESLLATAAPPGVVPMFEWEEMTASVQLPDAGSLRIAFSTPGWSPADFDDITIVMTGISGEVIQRDDYYPFGLTFNSYTSGTENLYKYNSFEEQKETGWYDYIARQYDPALGRFLQIDPLADVMRRHSPYNYAFDNPIRFIDPDGMAPDDVVINGDKADEAVAELQKSTSLKLSRDEESGKLSASGNAESESDKVLLEAINSETVTVEVDATSKKKLENGQILADGAYLGNTLGEDKKTVTADQSVNPEALGKISDFHGKPGADMLHEVVEAYTGGSMAIESGVNGSPETNYRKVHDKASEVAPQSGPTYEDDVNGVRYYFVGDGESAETTVIYNQYDPKK